MNTVDLFGMIAAVLTTSAVLPQVVKTIRDRDTRSLSLPMYVILTTGLLLWLTYGILIGDLALIIANSFTGIMAVIILAVKIKYDPVSKKPRSRIS